MMNAANVTATTMNAATTATIMKTSAPQNPLSLQQSGMIPAAIITTNERLTTVTNSTNSISSQHPNHEPPNTTPQSVTAFTIHAPTQTLQALPNNLTCSGNSSGPTQIQTMPANASIIHPASIASTVTPSVVCTATILPVTGHQVTAIPVGVPITVPTVSVLKAQPTATTLPIGQRFQSANVMTPSGPQTGSINTLYIQHQDQHSKNQNVAHSTSNLHHATHIQPNSVINATVSVAAPNATVHQQIPSAHTPAPLFIQTNSTAPNNAILHTTNIASSGHANSAQVVATNMSTINLTTSAAQSQQQTQQQQNQSAQFQRLKVEDALSYLDQVKYKFNDQPQVYNDFLDIMKEFKSQSIDTPGVIQRVSNLFKGHPELIVGFNTFLPPGYKIEIHANDQVNVSMPNSPSVILMSTTPVVTNQPAVATPTIVTGPGVHQQISGNLPRNVIVSSAATATSSVSLQQQHPGLAYNSQSYSNSVQVRDSTGAALTAQLGSASLAPSRIEPHANRAPSQPMDTSASRVQLQTNAQNVSGPQTGAQPVEFNHAINYVNKIKNRFQQQPEVYKQFLDILQNYQKEQRCKEGIPASQKLLTESEVFSKVAKLFQNQEDLLQEFSQFLPDANNNANAHNSNLLANSTLTVNNTMHPTNSSAASYSMANANQPPLGYNLSHLDGIATSYGGSVNSLSNNEHASMKKSINLINLNPSIQSSGHSNRTPNSSSPNSYQNSLHRNQKRSSGGISNNQVDQNSQHVPNKRSKIIPGRDSSFADPGKYVGDLSDYAFFDKLRVTLSCPAAYDNFLRCLILYNSEIISRTELFQLVTPIFVRCPDLLKRFRDLIGIKEGGLINSVGSHHNLYSSSLYHNSGYSNSYSNNNQLEGLSHRVAMMKDRLENEYVEVELNACKRYGISYRTIPKNSTRQECSGRTQLCHEVLNDTLVSFPSWSEDSTFVSSRKTQFEEYIYRCEDERYELDHVLESNSATIKVFETLMRKMDKMTADEKSNFRLDDNLGGTSEVIHQKTIKRLYGEKSIGVIEGLKNSPATVVPIVLRRLSAKDEEWRDAQKQFNKLWREQLEKYYLKSLDHQGINFKQNDIKILRTKWLLSEIENIFDERQAQVLSPTSTEANQILYQPHMVFVYPDKAMIDVACNLIIHHVKRQTSINKEDKQKIKQLMRHFIPDLFATPRGELSDDEFDDEEKNAPTKSSFNLKKTIEVKETSKVIENGENKPFSMLNSKPDEEYSLIFVNEYWFYFFRLHYILCERLSKMHNHSLNIVAEENSQKKNKETSPSTLLRLKNNLDVDVEDYFSTLVDMVKQVLDGNLDSNQFEDNLREMFGIHAYISFTLDKIVSYIVRQLQYIVSDEVSQQCYDMYTDALKTGSAGGLCITSHQRIENESQYQKNAEQAMSEENCFKVFIYKDEGKITFELLASNDDEDDSANEDEESNSTQSSRTLRSSSKHFDRTEKWNDLIDMDKVKEAANERLKKNPRFLERIIRRMKSLKLSINEGDSSSAKIESDKANAIGDEKPPESHLSKDHSGSDVSNKSDSQKECSLNKYTNVLKVMADNVLYRSFALKRARETHKSVSQLKDGKFSKWSSNWVESNSTPEQRLKFESWLLSSDTTNFDWNSPAEVPNRPSESESSLQKSNEPGSSRSNSEANSTDSANSSTSTKSLQRATIEVLSCPPYRTLCKYRFQ